MQGKLIKKINQYFHDIEVSSFSKRHEVRMENESTLYREFFRDFFTENQRPIKILDVGSGTGLVARAIMDNDYRFICTDISYNMLSTLKRNLNFDHRDRFSYVSCDVEYFPFAAGIFDLITCNAAMHHFPSINKFAQELERILSLKGKLIIGFETNRKFWTNKAVSFVYRLIYKICPNGNGNATNYNVICCDVNKRLLAEGIIDKPLSSAEILKYVDIHSPNAGERIDYSKGFDIDELSEHVFENFDAKILYHYNDSSKLFSIYNKLFFPKSAPQFRDRKSVV